MTKNSNGLSEDQLLVIAVKQGNKQAFGRVYDKYAPALLGIITRIVHTDSLAEELLQTTFLHIWDQIDSFDASKNSFFSWLLNIARHLSFDKLKSAHLKLKNPEHNNCVYNLANSNNADQTSQESLQKVIFDLVYFKGLSCKEAAAALNTPVEEIKMNIRSAIKNMREVKVL